MDKDIAQLLSWYANGTLSGADRDRVEAALRDDPDARALLDWEKSLRGAVRDDAAFDIPEDHKLADVMQRIRAEAKPAATKHAPAAPVTRKAKTAGAGVGARVAEWFRWGPAFALACGIVVVQFGIIVHMAQAPSGEENDSPLTRSVAGKGGERFIRVNFKPESTETDLRVLLRGIKAEIVSGPSQLGDYYLIVKAEGAQAALGALQSSNLVESAEIVNALPTRPS